MSSQLQIENATKRVDTGDLRQYFKVQDALFQNNDGNHDFQTFYDTCSGSSVPFTVGEETNVKLTGGVDIVNIDKTTITVKANCTFNYNLVSGTVYTPDANTSQLIKNYYIFVGLKSASHIIQNYKIWVNGSQIPNAAQLFALDEQTVVRASKPQTELQARPHMYTLFSNSYNASETVCGTYIKLSDLITGPVTKEIEFCFQIDDLLPFSAMELYPRYLYGDIVANIKTTLDKNFVWHLVDIEQAFSKLEPQETDGNSSKYPTEVERQFLRFKVDKCFNQCGDSAQIIVPNWSGSNVIASSQIARISISAATVTSCYSSSCGFNIKSDVKDKLAIEYLNRPMLIPAQMAFYKRCAQGVQTNGVQTSDSLSIKNATQIAVRFPRTLNQKTVSKNPMQQSFTVRVNDVAYPSAGNLSTIDSRHAELLLENLCFDTLFPANEGLKNALTFKEYNSTANRVRICPEDNTDYMFTAQLERSGNGVFFDGKTVANCKVDINGVHLYGTKNPAYFTSDTLNSTNLNPEFVVIQDAVWEFSKDGVRFYV